MFRSIVLLVGGLASLFTASLFAQEAVLGQEYGAGVHAFFTGDYGSAYEHLTTAIQGGSKDPRAFYFRGLACMSLGRAPDAAIDFHKGADLESADVNRFYDVGKSLERVQGAARAELEKYRVAARMAALEQAEKLRKERYEAVQREESRVLRRQSEGAPANGEEVAPPASSEEEEENPFATPGDESKPVKKPAAKSGKAKKPAVKSAPSDDDEDPFATEPKPSDKDKKEKDKAKKGEDKAKKDDQAKKPADKKKAGGDDDDPFATEPKSPDKGKSDKPDDKAKKPADEKKKVDEKKKADDKKADDKKPDDKKADDKKPDDKKPDDKKPDAKKPDDKKPDDKKPDKDDPFAS